MAVNFIGSSHCDIDYGHFVCYVIAPYFNRIVIVDLRNNEYLDDYDFEQLLRRRSPRVNVLKLNYIPKLLNHTLAIMKQYCQILEELELKGCLDTTTQDNLTILHETSFK